MNETGNCMAQLYSVNTLKFNKEKLENDTCCMMLINCLNDNNYQNHD